MIGLYDGSCGWIPLTQFIDYVLPSCSNAPPDICAHYLRTAAIEFCRRTSVLQDRTHLVYTPGVDDYALEPTSENLTVRSVERVSYNDKPLCKLDHMPAPNEQCYGYLFSPPRDLIVRPQYNYSSISNGAYPYYSSVSDQRGTVSIDVVMIPAQDAVELPEQIYDLFAENIADGALMRLFAMQGAPWMDTKLGGIHMSRFRQAVSATRVDVVKKFSTQPQYARGPRWC